MPVRHDDANDYNQEKERNTLEYLSSKAIIPTTIVNASF